MTKTTHFLGAAVLSLGLCLLGTARARADDHPCKDDIEKFCKKERPAKARVLPCLKQHASELSPACSEHIAGVKEKVQEIHEACQADAAKLCKDEKAGKGRILACLKSHESDLSEPCKAALAKPKAK
jgi:hypothetical protein